MDQAETLLPILLQRSDEYPPHKYREERFDYYPVEQRLRAVADTPLLVDVGGGRGHDLVSFQARYPQLPGKLVLQERPVVIDANKDLPSNIEAMRYDFFAPQPVKGAKACYLRTILHEWPDKQARQILANIRDAMTEDSILLINENVLPDSKVPLYLAELDLSMMALSSSLDRTVTQSKALLESADFCLIQI